MQARIEWIRSSAELATWLAEVPPAALAIDTESDSLHHYPERICLLQISQPGRDLLVDTLAGVDLGLLAARLADPGTRKILHGADYDLRVLNREHGLEVRGLFDTMVAARLAGETAFGLAALLERELGIRLDKRFQRADWSRRPLTPEMERYAAADTHHLADLAERLGSRLERLGRTAWAAEEFARLEAIRFTAREDAEAWRRVEGAATLDRRGLAVLRELHAARDAVARERAVPPFRVLHNATLIEIARTRPATVEALGARRLDAGLAARLLDAVARGRALAPGLLPELPVARRRRASPRAEAALRRLAVRRDEVARSLGLEPAILAPRAVLEAAIERADQGLDPAAAEGLRSWQRELLEPALRELAGVPGRLDFAARSGVPDA